MENLYFNAPQPENISDRDLYHIVKSMKKILIVGHQLHIKTMDGFWPTVSDSDAILIIRRFFKDSAWQPHLATDRLSRIIKSLKTDPDLQRDGNEFRHPDYLMFENGVWNISDAKIVPENIGLLFSRKVKAAPSEALPPESKNFVDFCKRVFSPENFEIKKRALYEIIAFCISDIENVKKAIFLIGPANCGKSVILRFIQKLVGEENVSNVSLDCFANRFSPMGMYGKKINIRGEIPSNPLSGRAFDTFKSITGGDRIELESKGQQPIAGVIRAKLLFAGNTIPVFSKIDGTDSYVERLHILIFDKSVNKENIDVKLEEKLWKDRDAIVRYSLDALKNFVSNQNEFLLLDDEKDILRSIADIANPVKSFIDECLEFGEDYAVYISDAFEAYRKFAISEALPDINRTTFRNLMSNRPGVKTGRKRRLSGNAPKSCFEGIRLKKKAYFNWQDTDLSYNMGGKKNE